MFFAHTTHFSCVLCFILISYCSIFKDRFAAVFTAACTLYHKWTGLVNSFLKNFLSFFRVFLDTQNMVVYTLCKPQYMHRASRAYVYIYNKWRKGAASNDEAPLTASPKGARIVIMLRQAVGRVNDLVLRKQHQGRDLPPKKAEYSNGAARNVIRDHSLFQISP